jgi:trimeric autotransporter adhesin
MKKIILTMALLYISIIGFSQSQNVTTTNPYGTSGYIPKFTTTINIQNSKIYDDGTNVGIGTTTPNSKLQTYESTALGGNAGDYQILASTSGNVAGNNILKNNVWVYRDAAGSTWFTARLHDGISIDNAYSIPQNNTRVWWERDPLNVVQSWGNSSTTYMSLVADKLGIGTTTPNNLLQVKDLINFDNTYYNTALGYKTLYSNTSGSDNTANGYQALYNNTSGTDNTAIGYKTLYSNTGADNTATGSHALYNNTTGYGNIANGDEALYTNTTGAHNTAIGVLALYTNTIGSFNIAIGSSALNLNATGVQNTAVGVNALEYNTGGYNTAIGLDALYSNTTGNNNTALGWYADVSSTGFTNATAIGSGALAANSDYVRVGNVNVSVIGGQVGWSNLSDGRFKFNIQENVKGLDFIKRLRPITYQMNTQAVDNFLIQNMPDSIKTKHQTGMNFAPSTAIIHSGFIAQEVDSVAHICGFVSSIVHTPANSTDPYALSYAEIVVPLVKAVQELNKTADSLKAHQKTSDSLSTIQATTLQNLLNHQQITDSLLAVLQNCCLHGTTQKTLQNDSGEQGNSTSIHNIELANNAILYQNAPNPFGDGTTIKYFVPDNTDAQIIFYDMFGNQLKVYKIEEKGMGQLNIGATNLAAGMYSYSLIVNEKVVDTKKMIKQ